MSGVPIDGAAGIGSRLGHIKCSSHISLAASTTQGLETPWMFPAYCHVMMCNLPSGKLTACNGKPPFLMGKSTIQQMAILNSQVKLPGCI